MHKILFILSYVLFLGFFVTLFLAFFAAIFWLLFWSDRGENLIRRRAAAPANPSDPLYKVATKIKVTEYGNDCTYRIYKWSKTMFGPAWRLIYKTTSEYEVEQVIQKDKYAPTELRKNSYYN